MLIPHAFRLTQGADLKLALLDYVKAHQIQAGSLLSTVGCLSVVVIRLANESETITLEGPLEVLSLTGTLTPEHVHLHISVADADGAVYGGHLVEGSIVSYTAEVCLAAYENLTFSREFDEQTGFTELCVKPR